MQDVDKTFESSTVNCCPCWKAQGSTGVMKNDMHDTIMIVNVDNVLSHH
jgi:hypothetical protein